MRQQKQLEASYNSETYITDLFKEAAYCEDINEQYQLLAEGS